MLMIFEEDLTNVLALCLAAEIASSQPRDDTELVSLCQNLLRKELKYKIRFEK